MPLGKCIAWLLTIPMAGAQQQQKAMKMGRDPMACGRQAKAVHGAKLMTGMKAIMMVLQFRSKLRKAMITMLVGGTIGRAGATGKVAELAMIPRGLVGLGKDHGIPHLLLTAQLQKRCSGLRRHRAGCGART